MELSSVIMADEPSLSLCLPNVLHFHAYHATQAMDKRLGITIIVQTSLGDSGLEQAVKEPKWR